VHCSSHPCTGLLLLQHLFWQLLLLLLLPIHPTCKRAA
jgi:hypothetical protein